MPNHYAQRENRTTWLVVPSDQTRLQTKTEREVGQDLTSLSQHNVGFHRIQWLFGEGDNAELCHRTALWNRVISPSLRMISD